MRTVLLTVCLVVAGCANKPLIWDKAGGTQAEFDADKRFCEFEVMKSTQTADPSLRTGVGQGIDLALRRRDLMAYCMRSKGYTARP